MKGPVTFSALAGAVFVGILQFEKLVLTFLRTRIKEHFKATETFGPFLIHCLKFSFSCRFLYWSGVFLFLFFAKLNVGPPRSQIHSQNSCQP